MDIMDQHFLPQCYLNEFCQNGKLFKIDCSVLKYYKTPYPREATPASICYGRDFYTLTSEFKEMYRAYKDLDPLFLEKQFHKYENTYPEIIKKINNGNAYLDTSDAIKFLFSCIDIKLRNDYYRDASHFNQKAALLDSVYDQELKEQELFTKINMRINIDKDSFDNALSARRNKLLSDPHFNKHTHLMSLISRYQLKSGIHDVIVSNLLFYKWKFFISNNKFITSDNPGWSLDTNSVVHNTKYDKGFQFIMPITGSRCLAITDVEFDLDYYNDPAKKLIYAGYASDDTIDRLNRLSINHFKRYLFAPSKEVGDEISKIIRLSDGN
jgi:hypothetical protein